MSAWTWGPPSAVRIVVTATNADGTVRYWYPDLREGRGDAQTIVLPDGTRSVTLERPRRVRVPLGEIRAARRPR
ncbi:MAG: hypothetical protein ACRDQ0_12115 [Pseudonocardia sp.]